MNGRSKALITAIIVFALLLSNPGVGAYSVWLRDRTAKEVDAEDDPLIMAVAAPMIEAATEDFNCGLFTVFRTGARVTVGILGRFVAIR